MFGGVKKGPNNNWTHPGHTHSQAPKSGKLRKKEWKPPRKWPAVDRIVARLRITEVNKARSAHRILYTVRSADISVKLVALQTSSPMSIFRSVSAYV